MLKIKIMVSVASLVASLAGLCCLGQLPESHGDSAGTVESHMRRSIAFVFSIRDIADDEEFEKTKAMLRLMCELNEGRRSGEEEGYVSSEDVRSYFHGKQS